MLDLFNLERETLERVIEAATHTLEGLDQLAAAYEAARGDSTADFGMLDSGIGGMMREALLDTINSAEGVLIDRGELTDLTGTDPDARLCLEVLEEVSA